MLCFPSDYIQWNKILNIGVRIQLYLKSLYTFVPPESLHLVGEKSGGYPLLINAGQRTSPELQGDMNSEGLAGGTSGWAPNRSCRDRKHSDGEKLRREKWGLHTQCWQQSTHLSACLRPKAEVSEDGRSRLPLILPLLIPWSNFFIQLSCCLSHSSFLLQTFLASSPFPAPVLSSHSVPLLYVVDRFPLGTMNKGKDVLGGGTAMGPGLEMWCVMHVGKESGWAWWESNWVERFIHLFNTLLLSAHPVLS